MSAPALLCLSPHAKDLGGGFVVRRLLPSAQRQSVGPFVFFDHFGPVDVTPDTGHDVRPHPHIGLATVTYLFAGAMMHRDSLGFAQRIEPGAINWMTAGRGIVHSERRPDELAQSSYVNHGIQLWAALPVEHEEVQPSFVHTAAADIPEVTVGQATVRVLIGEAYGRTSPVATYAPTLYLDVRLLAGAVLELPASVAECGVYSVDQPVRLGGEPVPAQQLAIFAPAGRAVVLAAGDAAARLIVIGGAPLDGHRHIWWNFVSSRKERILQAADDWKAQRMGQVPGDPEFIELPNRLPTRD